MEHVKKEDAVKHTNSSDCSVYEYSMQNMAMSIGVAEIAHRYPDQGYAINHTCSEMGYVLKGSGKLVTDTQEATLSPGDVIYIPAGEKFYWEGSLTIVLPTAPAWDPTQHEILKSSKEFSKL